MAERGEQVECPEELAILYECGRLSRLAAVMGLTLFDLGKFPAELVRRLSVAQDAREDYLAYVAQRAAKGT